MRFRKQQIFFNVIAKKSTRSLHVRVLDILTLSETSIGHRMPAATIKYLARYSVKY